jgi:hypothetical protein
MKSFYSLVALTISTHVWVGQILLFKFSKAINSFMYSFYISIGDTINVASRMESTGDGKQNKIK